MTRETVDQLIARVMAQHPGHGTPKLQLVYFEAVHQELAPLARELEAENQRLRDQLQGDWNAAKERMTTRQRAVFSCEQCSNVYKAGDMPVTLYAENGKPKCRRCDHVMTQTMEPKP